MKSWRAPGIAVRTTLAPTNEVYFRVIEKCYALDLLSGASAGLDPTTSVMPGTGLHMGNDVLERDAMRWVRRMIRRRGGTGPIIDGTSYRLQRPMHSLNPDFRESQSRILRASPEAPLSSAQAMLQTCRLRKRASAMRPQVSIQTAGGNGIGAGTRLCANAKPLLLPPKLKPCTSSPNASSTLVMPPK